MAALINGTAGIDRLDGGADRDVIYGYDSQAGAGAGIAITATRLATGFPRALFVGAPEGDTGRLFVVEQSGRIEILDTATNTKLPTPFLDISAETLNASEQGLLGLAFDPDFATNGRFYVNMINLAGDTEIRRYTVSSEDPNRADLASMTPIITIDQPDGSTHHKAGWLGFGPDGNLYADLGDGGDSATSQQPDNLLGKVLRLDVNADAFPGDATRNYAIPADNPFVGVAGADEIYALGLRNPFRAGFDRGLGDFYIGDVGQNTWEEIDRGAPGANYGWPAYEGPDPFGAGGTTIGNLTFPIYSYDHTVGHSVTGGVVYRGPDEGLQGQYFFADYVQAKLFTLTQTGGSWAATERTADVTPTAGAVNLISSFGEDGQGNLYVVDLGGEIFRLDPQFTASDNVDVLRGFGGDDLMFGGGGGDRLEGGDGNDEAQGGTGNDRIYGEAGNDLLLGGAGTDILDGGADNDTLDGGAGADSLRGGDGDDRYVVDNAGDKVVETTGVDTVRASISYRLPGGVENLDLAGAVRYGTGNGLANAIDGNAASNTLAGLDGDDSLFGRAGADRIEGGDGADRLAGGAGVDAVFGGDEADVFVFDVAPGIADRDNIQDFTPADDTLEISASLFGGGLVAGGAVPFVSNANPSSNGFAGGVFLYDTDNGRLLYDSDGGGGAAPELFAILMGAPTLTATDFSITR